MMMMVKKPSLSSLAQRSLRVRPDGPPPIRLSRTRLCQPSAPARRDALAIMLSHLAHLPRPRVFFLIFKLLISRLARFKHDDANTTRSVHSIGVRFSSTFIRGVTVRNRLANARRPPSWRQVTALSGFLGTLEGGQVREREVWRSQEAKSSGRLEVFLKNGIGPQSRSLTRQSAIGCRFRGCWTVEGRRHPGPTPPPTFTTCSLI